MASNKTKKVSPELRKIRQWHVEWRHQRLVKRLGIEILCGGYEGAPRKPLVEAGLDQLKAKRGAAFVGEVRKWIDAEVKARTESKHHPARKAS